MKISIGKLAVVVALGGLSIGLIGQGVGATFNASGTVSQKIVAAANDMNLTVTADGFTQTSRHGTVSIPCADIPVDVSTQATPVDICGTGGIVINYSGEAKVSKLVLTPSLVSNTIPQTELPKFVVAWATSPTVPEFLGQTMSLFALQTAPAVTLSVDPNNASGSDLKLSDISGSNSFTINPTITWGVTSAGQPDNSLLNGSLGTQGTLELTIQVEA